MHALESTGAVGEVADSIDNLIGALELPLPDALHVKAMKEALPCLRDRLREAFRALTGENPWGDRPKGD